MMKKTLMAAATVGDSLEFMNEIARTFPQSAVLASLDHFTEVGVEGIVIAAPGALHAEQAVDALERGIRISEKPPGCTGSEGLFPKSERGRARHLLPAESS